jgi:hypothetical protein
MFAKSNAAGGSSPAAHFLVYYVPNPLCQARVTTAEADFLFWACGGILDLRAAVVPPICTIFSLERLIAVGTWHTHGMQQCLYRRMAASALLLRGGHQEVIDAVGDGTSC